MKSLPEVLQVLEEKTEEVGRVMTFRVDRLDDDNFLIEVTTVATVDGEEKYDSHRAAVGSIAEVVELLLSIEGE